MRRLEIGPGAEGLPGFETFNIRPPASHIGDARRLPFPDSSFDEVYSSHCIEHIDWHDVEATIAEWARVLRPCGTLEIHTVDAFLLMKSLVDIEYGDPGLRAGKWRSDLHRGDPYKWAVGRLLSYAKKADGGINLHRALITPSYLRLCFEAVGLVDLEAVEEPRGPKKHRGVNLGLRGRKC